RSPTTHGAQTAVEGRDYTTLSIIDSKGVSGARISILTMLDNGRTVISNNPPGAHGQLIAQAQVGIQSGKSRTWFLPQIGVQPRQAYEAAAYGRSLVWLET